MGMKNMTAGQIASACGGTFYGANKERGRQMEAVTTDSRTAGKDHLFVPIKGARADGHDFIGDVVAKGAFPLSEHRLDQALEPYILVNSTAQALKDIAEYYRQQVSAKVVGVVGSVGKTSTKEMIASVLSEKYRVLKTEGNFNNEIGLPLTIFRIRKEHEAAVVEMGISDFGEMHRLAKIARPDIIVMTNIGDCHLEQLGDRDGVLRAKSEVFDFVTEDTVIVLNADDDKLRGIQCVKGISPLFFGVENPVLYASAQDAKCRPSPCRPGPQAVLYASAQDAKCRPFPHRPGAQAALYASAQDVKSLGPDGVSAIILTDGKRIPVSIPLPGLHNVWNALAAACVGNVLGLSAGQIRHGIEHARTIQGRSHFVKTGQMTIIDDCYNANPMSMKASLDVLATMPGRKIAILGDMGELGENEKKLHYEVGQYAAAAGIDALFLCGELSRETEAGAKQNPQLEIFYYREMDDLKNAVCAYAEPGDVILVKASHFMGYQTLVDALSAK